MNCRSCQQEVYVDGQFCPYCGSSFYPKIYTKKKSAWGARIIFWLCISIGGLSGIITGKLALDHYINPMLNANIQYDDPIPLPPPARRQSTHPATGSAIPIRRSEESREYAGESSRPDQHDPR